MRLTGTVKGFQNVMRAPNLRLQQLLPDPVGDLDINCCPDPDCHNFGERAIGTPGTLSRVAQTGKATLLGNSAAVGLGRYRMSKLGDNFTRVSRA